MSKIIRLKRGLDIRLKGKAENVIGKSSPSGLFAVKLTDFPDLAPKLLVKEGDEVKAGTPLFFDKYHPEILFVSPVSGVVEAVIRGERRKILSVTIKPDEKNQCIDFGIADPSVLGRDEVKDLLLKSGLWPMLRQRPYGRMADPAVTPLNIFISGFDSAPLAPDYAFVLKGKEASFQTGINALARLTDGKVFLGVPEGSSSGVFSALRGVDVTTFAGPHPSGNVGVQIHHTCPVDKGDVVWTINPQDVVAVGRLFETGKADFSRVIALTGSEVKAPQYYQTVAGASIASVVGGKLNSAAAVRIIGGNVLTGKTIEADGFIGFFDQQLTVVPEGDYFEFLGWAKPRLEKFSMSRAYFSWLMPGKEYRADTNLNGEERAYVMTGQYEKVVPMDILPVHLVKAIIAEDIDKMEKLGIYEVIEEDLALCEYVCTSKIEVQDILRKGINLMIKELG